MNVMFSFFSSTNYIEASKSFQKDQETDNISCQSLSHENSHISD